MLEVVNVVPAEGTINLYVDANLNIEFNKEVSEVSLNSMVFTLYAQTPKADGSGNFDYAAVGVNIIKSAENVNKIIITPMVVLEKSQDYLLMILGDRNLGDSVPQGVLSTTNEVMDGNFTLNFTTGIAHAPSVDTEPVVVIDTDFTDDNNVDTDGDGIDDATIPVRPLEVIEVNPLKLFDTVSIGELEVVFNQDIIVSEAGVYHIDGFNLASEGQYVPLELREPVQISGSSIYMRFKGTECVSGEFQRIPDGELPVLHNNEAPMPHNHKYKVSFLRSRIKGKTTGSLLSENADVEITTKLFPKFANAYETRVESKGLLGSNISDEIIEMSLHSSTKFILDRVGWNYGPCLVMDPIAKQLYTYMKRYVICKSIFDSIGAGNGGRGPITSKSLGDFSISYSSSKSSGDVKSALEYIQGCMVDMYDLIMAFMGRGAAAVTKSADTANYPGRRRTGRLNNDDINY